jgi:aldehyde:ferredoxin oxidoreductase
MIHQIARKEGFGEVLAEGAMRAIERIGNGAQNFVAHVKGMSIYRCMVLEGYGGMPFSML